MRSISRLIFAIFLAAIFVAGQTAKPVWKGTITIENGVTVIRNPKDPLFQGDILRLQEEISIGRGEKKGDFLFAAIGSPYSALAVDAQGSIYVLDWKDCQIKAFASDGRFLRAFSRKGQGPGDLEAPAQIFLSPKNEIIVECLMTQTLHFFSTDGHFLKRENWSTSSAAGFYMDPHGNLLGVANNRAASGKFEYQLKLFDSKMGLIRLLERWPNPSFSPEGIELFRPGGYVYQVMGEEFLTGFQEEYKLKILDGSGRTKKLIENDYRPIPITAKDIEAATKNYRSIGGGPPKWIIPKYHLPFLKFLTDEEGRIFVLTFEKTEDREKAYWDIFDQEGRYIGRQAFRSSPYIWKKDKLYSIESDEDGYQYVKRYSVRWLNQ